MLLHVYNIKHNLTGNSTYEHCEFYFRHYGLIELTLYNSFVILLCAIIKHFFHVRLPIYTTHMICFGLLIFSKNIKIILRYS